MTPRVDIFITTMKLSLIPSRVATLCAVPVALFITLSMVSCEKKTKEEKIAEEIDEAIQSKDSDELRENIGDIIKEAAEEE